MLINGTSQKMQHLHFYIYFMYICFHKYSFEQNLNKIGKIDYSSRIHSGR